MRSGLDGGENLGAMRRYNELGIPKCTHQITQNPLLPLRMQVQLDFIDQGDRLGFEGIRKVWIALCHAPGQIGGKREHGLIAAA